ncbi:MAG: putative ABC transporter permease [Sphaerochaetaceae bacterium]|nr:putative ABC transporter permease [Sphaerochaetaceae bacterium]
MEKFSIYVISFFIYCVVGYICEVIYCGIPAKKFINRGFLHGPYLPIYGFGGLSIQLLSELITTSGQSANIFVVFFCGMLLASIIEYIGSFILEKAFGIKLWDYSKHKFNLNGRICLLNSSLFGGLSVVAVFYLMPIITKLHSLTIFNISSDRKELLAEIILIVMGSDFASSIISMNEFKRNIQKVRYLVKEMPERLKLATDGATRKMLKNRLLEEIDELRMEVGSRSNRILKAFPSMTSKFDESKVQMELLKMNLESLRERGNKIRKERLQNLKQKISK